MGQDGIQKRRWHRRFSRGLLSRNRPIDNRVGSSAATQRRAKQSLSWNPNRQGGSLRSAAMLAFGAAGVYFYPDLLPEPKKKEIVPPIQHIEPPP